MGYMSSFFDLKNGVRQGCPLSAYLFIICVELLAINIRYNNEIIGIKVGNRDIKISQLADDTTAFIQNTKSMHIIFQTLDTFYHSSGLKPNLDKTKAMYIGSLKGTQHKPFEIEWLESDLNYLKMVDFK